MQPVPRVVGVVQRPRLILKIVGNVEEGVAVFLGVVFEQGVVVVDVLVGQRGHLQILPVCHRQNRLDDNFAVGRNGHQLVDQDVVFFHELLVGHQRDGVDPEGDKDAAGLALSHRFLYSKVFSTRLQLDESVLPDGLLGAAVDGKYLLGREQLIGQQAVGAAVPDEGGLSQIIFGVNLMAAGAFLGLFRLCPGGGGQLRLFLLLIGAACQQAQA